jgi:hypothetical protein
MNNDKTNELAMKPLNRKIAISNSTLLQQKNRDENSNESNLINLLPSSKLNINTIKYGSGEGSTSFGPKDKMMLDMPQSTVGGTAAAVVKRLKRTELLIGDTYAAQSPNATKLTPPTSANNPGPSVGASNLSTSIITASSWRIGEALAQKHLLLKEQSDAKILLKHENDKENNDLNGLKIHHLMRNNGAEVEANLSTNKGKIKRTDCHLIGSNHANINGTGKVSIHENESTKHG